MQQCSFVINRGAKKGTQCSTTTKGQYCYKHKDSVAARGVDKAAGVANDPIFHKPAEVAKEEPTVKLKSSVFAITINSNKAYETMSEADKLKFKQFVDWVCDENGGLYDYIHDSTSDDPRENIKELVCEHYFESGTKLGKVHAHVYLSLVHTGHMRILLDDLRCLALKVFGERIFIGIIPSSSPEVAWRNYIRKGDGKVDL